MEFDLETVVNRKNTGNLKGRWLPEDAKKAGVLSLAPAEMDFRTAPSIIRAMCRCAENGLMGFTLMDEPYQAAVCDWMERVRKQKIDPDWIVPTQGTIFSVATCLRMCGGKRLIIQTPVYNRYKQAADRLGFETVENPLIREADGSYRMDLEDLERKMADPANGLLVICNPQNPTGSVWPRETLESVARLAVKYDLVVYSDEIFADYPFTEEPVTMFTTVLDGKNNGISATGLGKTFNFTGVNHANMIIADSDLRERFTKQKYADHYGSIDPMHRAALLGAYCDEGIAWKDAVHRLIWENYQTVKSFFTERLPQVMISPLQGGYVLWLDWRAVPKAQELMDKAMFVLEEGTDFGAPGFYRMSIATPKAVLHDALQRLTDAMQA